MKKLLIASAALAMVAGTAQAQSSVTVYGTLDIGYGESKSTTSQSEVNGTRKTSTTGNGDGGLSTSVIGFRGSEDLGGGNKANFHLEYDLMDAGQGGQATATAPSAATTAGFGRRLGWVGLESAKLGQVRLGRQATASHGNIVAFSAGMANNTVGAVYSAGTAGSAAETPNLSTMPNEASIRPHQVFVDRLVTYISPSFGGLVATVQYGQTKQDSTNNAGTPANRETEFNDMSLRYTAGKLDLGASYQVSKATRNTDTLSRGDVNTVFGMNVNNVLNSNVGDVSNAKAKVTMFGASYNFGVVQPFALYTERKTDASGLDGFSETAKQKATEIGVRAPVTSAVMVFASAYDGDFKRSNSDLDQGKADLSGYQLGVTYALSKRTTAYAITGKQETKNAMAGETGKNKTTGTSVGVRHTF